MYIKLTPAQIPRLWENIKFSISKTSCINEKDMPLYLNRLLHALLSSKAQCIVRLDEDRNLLAIGITRIIDSLITGESILFIESFYSFSKIPAETWEELMVLTKKFAKKEKCTKMTTYSSNPRIYEVVKAVGFTEYYRYFSMEV